MKSTRIKRLISFVLAVIAGISLCSCIEIKFGKKNESASATTEADSSETTSAVDPEGSASVTGESETAATETISEGSTTETTKETIPDETAFGVITLLDYSAITAEEQIISNEEVISKIKQMIASFPEPECDSSVKVAELYDMANIDYAGYINDVQFEGGTAEGADLLLGSGKFIPGFEDQIVGMKVGETKDIFVTFPENYNEQYAGKDAKFTIKLNSLTRYTISDANMVMLSEKEDMTVEKYKAYIKEELRIANVIDEIWEKYVEGCTYSELNSAKLQEYVDNKRNTDEQYAGYYGMTLSEYTKMTDEEYDDFVLKYATARYKEDAVIYSIIKKENLELTEDDKINGTIKYAIELGLPVEDFRTYYPEETVNKVLMNDKAIRFVAEHVTIVSSESASESTN